jgi:hypothetical protein
MRDKPVRKGKKPDGQQSASLMWACEVAAAQVRASALERDREAEEATKNRCSNFIGSIGTGGQGPWQGREGGRENSGANRQRAITLEWQLSALSVCSAFGWISPTHGRN